MLLSAMRPTRVDHWILRGVVLLVLLLILLLGVYAVARCYARVAALPAFGLV